MHIANVNELFVYKQIGYIGSLIVIENSKFLKQKQSRGTSLFTGA